MFLAIKEYYSRECERSIKDFGFWSQPFPQINHWFLVFITIR